MREYEYTNEIVELVKEVLDKNGLVYFLMRNTGFSNSLGR